MSDTNVRRDYKDTMFRMLFKEKENLLSLYNALNKTSYTNTDDLEITTLESAVYMNYKNDVSFVFHSELLLYEHQSTINPNMPLRNLVYVSKVLRGITKNENLYGSALVKIPAPKFVIFYNGTDPQPERWMLRLSDAFESKESAQDKLPEESELSKQEQPNLELLVTAYNINFGYNPELMEACRLLKEYAQYVEQVRKYAKEMEFPSAVEQAVDYCIHNGILSDFLSKNRAEAIEMSIFEYDEEKHIKSEKALSYKEGIEKGIERGQERLDLLNKKLLEENRIDDLKRSIEDEAFRKKLYEKYHISLSK